MTFWIVSALIGVSFGIGFGAKDFFARLDNELSTDPHIWHD